MAENGFLEDAITNARLFTDEPSVNPKYTDAQIAKFIGQAHTRILAEVNRLSSDPIVQRMTLSVSATQRYVLPPTVGEVLRLGSVNSTTGLVDWEFRPRHRLNPLGPGYTLEGNVIRFEPILQDSYTLTLLYIPRGTPLLYKYEKTTTGNPPAEYGSDASLGDWVEVPLATDEATDVTFGRVDRRPNAYAGMMLRLLDDENAVVQERAISAYTVPNSAGTPAAGKLYTLDAFSPSILAAAGSTLHYEVVPFMSQEVEEAVELDVSRTLTRLEGDMTRARSLDQLFRERCRDLRLSFANYNNRVPTHYAGDTVDNNQYYPSVLRAW